MKKIFLVGLIICLLLSLTACAMPFEFLFPSDDTRITIEKTNETYDEAVISKSLYTIRDIMKLLNNDQKGYMPSVGEARALVIPILFNDQDEEVMSKYDLNDIEKAFFGESKDTGWESLSSYYYKSSYKKLKITGTVTPWYKVSKNAVYYENGGFDKTYTEKIHEILREALNSFDEAIDYSNYDMDKDGIIDAVYLLYADKILDSSTTYWAWQDFYNDKDKWDNKEAHQFVWCGMDFLFTDNQLKPIETINSSTIIHETGHMLGIPDYYDYDPNYYDDKGNKVESGKGCNLGIGGMDMMDENIGDHNAFTKTILGWITPKVVIGSTTISLNSFSDKGDAIIILPEFNIGTNILTEFFIVEYYTPTSLNAEYEYSDIGGGFKEEGIRIFHVNARIDLEPYYYQDLFSYDNSKSKYGLISLVSKDEYVNSTNEYLDSSYYADEKSLFKKGDSYHPTNTKQNQNEALKKYTLTVNDIKDGKAILNILFD